MLPSKQQRDLLLRDGEDKRQQAEAEEREKQAQRTREREAAEKAAIQLAKKAARVKLAMAVEEACQAGRHCTSIRLVDGYLTPNHWCHAFVKSLASKHPDYKIEGTQQSEKRYSYREIKCGEDFETEEYNVYIIAIEISWE